MRFGPNVYFLIESEAPSAFDLSLVFNRNRNHSNLIVDVLHCPFGQLHLGNVELVSEDAFKGFHEFTAQTVVIYI